MTPLRPYRLLAALALIVLGTSGCKFMSAFTDHSSQPVLPGQITAMPRVTVTDLDATGRRLAAAGLTVVVRRPEIVVNVDREYGAGPLTLPETTRPFEPAHWNHMIAAQDPPPGAAVRAGTVITLTAGIHHGAGPFRPWIDAHGGSVGLRGEQRCRECHPADYCSACHLKLNLPTKNR